MNPTILRGKHYRGYLNFDNWGKGLYTDLAGVLCLGIGISDLTTLSLFPSGKLDSVVINKSN